MMATAGWQRLWRWTWLSAGLLAPFVSGAAEPGLPLALSSRSSATDGAYFRLVSADGACAPGAAGCTTDALGYPGGAAAYGSPGYGSGGAAAPGAMSAFAPEASVLGNPDMFAAATGETSAAVAALSPGGYLDVAAPVTMFRLRYDTANNNAFPDRGEYFYAKCGCFRQMGVDPDAEGPIGLNDSVDYQEIRPYFEYAHSAYFSVFLEVPVRFVEFTTTNQALGALGSQSGLGDINFGFKYAIIAEECEYLTFQLRIFTPTGDAGQGLGNAHLTIEPALLYFRQLPDNFIFQGQLAFWNPVDVSSYASNVMQYGIGLGYLLADSNRLSLVPTLEVVGWTFLNGYKLNTPANSIDSAKGDNILNIKPGVRMGFGAPEGPQLFRRHSVYTGFGIPITNDRFYDDLFRLEYRYVF